MASKTTTSTTTVVARRRAPVASGDARATRLVDAARRRRHAAVTWAGKRRGIGDILSDELDPERASGREARAKTKKGGARDGGAQFDASGSRRGGDEKWLKVGNVRELDEKPIKALILANGNFCMVKYGSMVFITACNSTAYQYPLIDGELFEGAMGAAIRSPLDGTEYDLATGEVLKWCPQDNMMRKLLGGLKKAVNPIPLPVYPTKINEDGDVFTFFV